MENINLVEVTELVHTLLRLKEDEKAKAEMLSAASARVRLVEDNLLPNSLREVDMLNFTLSDGRVVSVEPNVSASITEANWPAAEEWLIDNQCDGIIKNQVIVEFDKGMNDRAGLISDIVAALLIRPNLVDFLGDLIAGVGSQDPITILPRLLMLADEFAIAEIKAKKSIHAQTLKAFVRECMRKGTEVPEDLFSLFITDHVKITNPR